MGFVTFESPRPDGEALALTVLWGVTALAYAIGFVLYLRRRQIDVIAARQPLSIVANVLVLWINLSMGSFVEFWLPQDQLCARYWIYSIQSFCLLGLFAVGMWRCLELIYKFESQRIKLAVKLRAEGFDSTELALDFKHQSNFFSRNLSLLTSWQVGVLLLLYTAFNPIFRLATGSRSELVGNVCNRNDPTLTYFEVGLCIGLAGLAFKIRSSGADVFGVKRELKYHGLLSIGHVIWQIVSSIWMDSRAVLAHLETLCVLWTLWRVSVWWPLRRSYGSHAQHKSKPLTVPPQFATFAALTSTKPGKLSFQQHLIMEFSIENLSFVDAITAFRNAKPTLGSTARNSGGVSPLAGGTERKRASDGDANVPVTIPQTARTSAPGIAAPTVTAATAVTAGGTAAHPPPSPLASPTVLSTVADHAEAAAVLHSPAIGAGWTVEAARQRAAEIYFQFIARGAPFEVTLPSHVTTPLHAEFDPFGRGMSGVNGQLQIRGMGGIGGSPAQRPSTISAPQRKGSNLLTLPIPAAAPGRKPSGSVTASGASGSSAVTMPNPAAVLNVPQYPNPLSPANPSPLSQKYVTPILLPSPASGGGLALETKTPILPSSTINTSQASQPAQPSATPSPARPSTITRAANASAKRFDVSAAPVVARDDVGPRSAKVAFTTTASSINITAPAATAATAAGTVGATVIGTMQQSHVLAPHPSNTPSSLHALSIPIVTIGGPAPADRTAAFYLTIFDSAYKETLSILQNDSFKRYLHSALFEQLLASEAVRRQLAREVSSGHNSRNPSDDGQGNANSADSAERKRVLQALAVGTGLTSGTGVDGGAEVPHDTATDAHALAPAAGGGSTVVLVSPRTTANPNAPTAGENAPAAVGSELPASANPSLPLPLRSARIGATPTAAVTTAAATTVATASGPAPSIEGDATTILAIDDHN